MAVQYIDDVMYLQS